ncbi:MAG: TonB-dependent receptor plug domain-containing protein [Bacteroidetes bacterium]|nr:TonB-dependent receptor plug domain-containing protein [Bacteroidota bacterium]
MKLKTIVIIALSLLVVEVSFAQEKKKTKKILVSGYVTDVYEMPLEGVSIIVDDAISDVMTNKKGFYKIKVQPDTKTIMAYSFNHGGIEVNFTGRTKINFILLADSTNSNYVSSEEGKMLDYGYGKVSKKHSTSSIANVEDNVIKDNTYTDIYEMIKGKVAGVAVTGKQITIRGISSLTAQGNPLFVVNGMETNSIDHINPRDVQSISVLKGPSAAIYGSRGSMGVIIINLRSGNK